MIQELILQHVACVQDRFEEMFLCPVRLKLERLSPVIGRYPRTVLRDHGLDQFTEITKRPIQCFLVRPSFTIESSHNPRERDDEVVIGDYPVQIVEQIVYGS